ncbi:UDP-N-acetylglucosamine 2-epimerase [Candidatus Pacearchaeota archaeon]|nr:UDP-N-acetylglucosamine 2-epimerase [Candidatus Pacearchaeota archaeon]
MRGEYPIAIIIGTKAELIKCMPIMIELQNQKKEYWFLHTGQHPLEKSCEDFNVKKPDFILSKEPKISTKFWSKINNSSLFWFFLMIFKIKAKLKELRPVYVIYHGDTMSTAAAAIGSSKILNPSKQWRNVHLEAGLRSGSIWEPFPEEISRRISDGFSDILLAVSDLSEKNLRNEYKDRKIILKIGNTIIDSSLSIYKKAEKKFKAEREEYVLINSHRHEHLKNKQNLIKIIKIINSIKTKGIWPLHDNTEYHLKKYGLFDKINREKILITPLKSYEEFIFLLANCKYLIADGGSIQEESLVFKKPCLILRNRTERQEGLKTGLNFITMNVGLAKKIINNMEENRINVQKFKNPYGEEGLSKKIVDALN